MIFRMISFVFLEGEKSKKKVSNFCLHYSMPILNYLTPFVSVYQIFNKLSKHLRKDIVLSPNILNLIFALEQNVQTWDLFI